MRRQNFLIQIKASAVLLAQVLSIVAALRGLKPDLTRPMP